MERKPIWQIGADLSHVVQVQNNECHYRIEQRQYGENCSVPIKCNGKTVAKAGKRRESAS